MAPDICPVCGDQKEGGGHSCPGPRVSWSGSAPVLGGDITLVEWGPDYVGYAEQARLAAEDEQEMTA